MLLGFSDFALSGPNEILNGIVGGGSDSDIVQEVTKTFMKGGEEKGVNYVFPVAWIKPKGEKRKSNIKINAKIFMGIFFSFKQGKQLMEFRCILKTLRNKVKYSYIRGTKVVLDSVQNIFDQNTKPNMFTIVKFLSSTTAKLVNAVKLYVFDQHVRRKNKFCSLGKKKTKQIDDFQLFKTNHTNLY